MSKTIFPKTANLLALLISIDLSPDLTAQIDLDLGINNDEVNRKEHILNPGHFASLLINRCGTILNSWEHETYAGLENN